MLYMILIKMTDYMASSYYAFQKYIFDSFSFLKCK